MCGSYDRRCATPLLPSSAPLRNNGTWKLKYWVTGLCLSVCHSCVGGSLSHSQDSAWKCSLCLRLGTYKQVPTMSSTILYLHVADACTSDCNHQEEIIHLAPLYCISLHFHTFSYCSEQLGQSNAI